MFKKAVITTISAIGGLFIYSYAASFIYYFIAGYTETPMLWSAWSALLNPISDKTVSQLWIAFGAPVVALLFAGAQIQALLSNKKNALPDASWAEWSDIKKSRLAGNEGIILGKYNGKYLMSNSPTHIMLIAPTRSGKGVGPVTSNLLNFSGSIICLDLKHENHKNTSGFRAQYGKVYKWSPLSHDNKSHCYNPLGAIGKDPHRRVTDLQIFAKTLIADPPKGDPMWTSEARALFVGLALYVFEIEEEPTIGTINRLLGAEADLGDICRHITKTHKELPQSIVKPLNVFANKASKEKSGVKTSVNTALNLWDNPTVDAATSKSDFNIADIRKERATIYISVGTEEIATLAPLLRLFFEQTIKILSKKKPEKDEPHQVLLLMDEFHMIGRMDSMTSAFTLLAGYNVRVLAVVQSLSWLDTTYDRMTRNGILSCCAHQIFFATNDPDTEEYVSRACGEKTIAMQSTSQRHNMNFDPPTKNISFRTTPLIPRHAVRTYDNAKEIILVEANKPIEADKIRFFEETSLRERSEISPTDVPELQIQEIAVPKFNIKPEGKDNKKEPDPNQGDIFAQDLLNNN